MIIDDVQNIINTESSMLDSLRPHISRKLQFSLEEKLKTQTLELNRLLGLDKNITENRSRYSNVLDSQYFEQVFLS